MRVRFRSIEYQFGGAAQSLERHFRELREDLLRQGQQYGLLHPGSPWRPPVDIHETPGAILIKIELAGMREDEIELTLYDNALVVTGRRDDDPDHDEDVCYHEAQVRYGPFRAEIVLPAPVQASAAEATYQNGFLRVRLPKTTPSEPGAHGRGTGGSRKAPGSGIRNLNAAPTVDVVPLAGMGAVPGIRAGAGPVRRSV
jgi:HSP20 family protein